MHTESKTLAVQSAPKASDQLASFLGIDKAMMLNTLKAQCFTGKRPEEVTDEQLAAFVSTANVLQVNPLIPGMLYAFPSKNGGIVPVLGPDGVFKKLDEMVCNGKLIGFDCVVFPEDVTLKPTHAIATIYRGKDFKPVTYTALYAEWAVQNSPVWNTKPRHMLWTRAIKQCARQVIHGLPMDAEEYAMSEMLNVTPDTTPDETPAPKRPAPPKRNTKGVAAVVENTDRPEPDAPAPVIDLQPEPEAAPTPEPAPVPAPEPEPAKATAANKPDESDFEPTPEDKRPKATRTSLNDGEQYSATIEVVEVTPFMANVKKGNDKIPTPSVSAVLKGEYEGTVMDIGGGIKKGDEVIPANYWKVGARLSIELIGKLNKASGNVGTRVESAKLLEAPAGNAAVEVE